MAWVSGPKAGATASWWAEWTGKVAKNKNEYQFQAPDDSRIGKIGYVICGNPCRLGYSFLLLCRPIYLCLFTVSFGGIDHNFHLAILS
jgi:hypothetical protein